MTIPLIIKGLVFGFLASVGLGAVTILVINRTFSSGRRAGFISGAGSAFSDTIYATIAFLGVGVVISFIEDYQGYIRLLIMLVLLVFAVKMWKKRTSIGFTANRSGTMKSFNLFSSSFMLALSNPIMVMVYLGIFTLFPDVAVNGSDWPTGLGVIVGIFLGALLWWFALTLFLARVGRMVSDRFVRILNELSVLVILCLAIYSGISGFISLFQ